MNRNGDDMEGTGRSADRSASDPVADEESDPGAGGPVPDPVEPYLPSGDGARDRGDGEDHASEEAVAEHVDPAGKPVEDDASTVWTVLRYSWASITFFVGGLLIPIVLLGVRSTGGSGSSPTSGLGLLGILLLLYAIVSLFLFPISLYRRDHPFGTYAVGALTGYLALNLLQGILPYGRPASLLFLTALGFLAGVYLFDELLPGSSIDRTGRDADPTTVGRGDAA